METSKRVTGQAPKTIKSADEKKETILLLMNMNCITKMKLENLCCNFCKNSSTNCVCECQYGNKQSIKESL